MRDWYAGGAGEQTVVAYAMEVALQYVKQEMLRR